MRIIFVGMGGVRELGEGWRGVRGRAIAALAAIVVRSGVVERCVEPLGGITRRRRHEQR
jgi:hypothetical protein